jgi:alkylation response protein AidB-like acyl-CoA dehydrogenase
VSNETQLQIASYKSIDDSTIPKFTTPITVSSPDFDRLLFLITSDAKERRMTGGGAKPYYALNLIKQSKLGALRLPVELGGGGASIRELFYAVIRLAEADPDVAHILRTHYSYVDEFLRHPAKQVRDTWLAKAADGAIFGNAFTELSSRNVGNLEFETTLSLDGEGYRLNGTKYFTTGTLYADWVVVMACTPDDLPVKVVIPTDREGVVVEDDWDGIGQKLTGSGTTRLNNVFVHSNEILEIHKDEVPFNSFVQLYLQAIMAGILRNVVTDASDLVHRRFRSFSYAPANTPHEDPLLQQIIGQLSSSAFAAEAIVLSAADALDTAVNVVVNGEIDYTLSHQASLRAAQAKVIVDDIALKASSLLFEVGGASATRQSAHLDRHWRNIRTLASHNPTVYKARAIGNYVVNGTELPLRAVYF